MNQEDLSKRLDIIERTLNQTKTYAQFSGVVAMVTGAAILIWGWFSLTPSAFPVTDTLTAIGFLSLFTATSASVYKSKKSGQPVFSHAIRQILMQGVPFAIIGLAVIVYFRTTPPIFFPLMQILYGLFIWSCRLLIPKPIALFGLAIILFTLGEICYAMRFSADQAQIVGAMITLGLGHLITGFILYRHGHA